MKTRSVTRDHLVRYAAGELSVAEAELVEDAIARDPRLRELLVEVRRGTLVRATMPSLPTFLATAHRAITTDAWWSFVPSEGRSIGAALRASSVVNGKIVRCVEMSVEAVPHRVASEESFDASLRSLDATHAQFELSSPHLPPEHVVHYAMLTSFAPVERSTVSSERMPAPERLQSARAERTPVNDEVSTPPNDTHTKQAKSLVAESLAAESAPHSIVKPIHEYTFGAADGIHASYIPSSERITVETAIPSEWTRDAVIAEITCYRRRETLGKLQRAIELTAEGMRGRRYGVITGIPAPESWQCDELTIDVRSVTSRDLHLLHDDSRRTYLAEYPAAAITARHEGQSIRFSMTDALARDRLNADNTTVGLLVGKEA